MTPAHTRARLTGGAALLGVAALAAATLSVIPASADAQSQTTTSRAAANGTVRGVMDHLIQLEEIGDTHGNRAAGFSGYEASRDYVVRRLEKAGYSPKVQSFEFPYYEQTGPSTFEVTAPAPITYVEGENFVTLEYSGAGDVTAPVEAVDTGSVDPSDSGCEAADFEGFTSGNIALVRRGTCNFSDKVQNAEAAGAVAVIVMNQGNTPERSGELTGVTLGVPVGVPVIGVSTATGDSLMAEGTVAHIVTDTTSEARDTWNVIAQTKQGNGQNVVMAGAHLDSVAEGNGINDNGSGSAALLETAEAMAQGTAPKNKVRFAWWGAEEAGLLGSHHYVDDLSTNSPAKFQNIALYLNFDMVGSPNYMLGVYDGDNDAFPEEESAIAPEGSAAIERMYVNFFDKLGTGSVPTAFSGRSDYGPFIDVNVPAGGLFTGAEGIKTADEAALFGGTAGEAYDPCYHAACDDLGNLSRAALRANLAAIQHSVQKYARSTKSVNGDGTGHTPPPPAAERRTASAPAAHGHAVR